MPKLKHIRREALAYAIEYDRTHENVEAAVVSHILWGFCHHLDARGTRVGRDIPPEIEARLNDGFPHVSEEPPGDAPPVATARGHDHRDEPSV